MKKALLSMMLVCCCLGGAAGAEEKTVWVTMGEDVFDRLARSSGVLGETFPPESYGSEGGVVITRLAPADLEKVAAFIHENSNRCGGFIVHDSLAEARDAMQGANRNRFAPMPAAFEIDRQTLVQQLLPLLDKTNILDTIEHLSTSYSNRYYTNASGQQSALWIRDLWQGYAGGRSDVTVTTYDHGSYVQPSVILTIDGATVPDEVIVLGGHLDTKLTGAGNGPSSVSPGADDNASGIAALSETIRVLMAEGFVPDRTVKFMGYAAEEVGLLGSGDIAADHAAAGTDVVAVMQFDMTDFNGSVEDIVFIDDNTNADLTSFVVSLVETYQPSLQWTTTSCGYACSDHASWHNQGFPAVFPFEARFGDHNQTIHTPNDTLATLGNQTDHALKFAKVAVSFAVETGLADAPPPGNPRDAAYDGGLGVPACAAVGSSCDSTDLLDGRANVGPEPNQPNTLDGCTDGTSGSYHSDESIDRIVVSTLDGADFAEGATVEIEVDVWAWNNGSADTLDLYYAADATNPSWTYVTSVSPPGGGARTLSAQYTLPAGGQQAVRANFRYQGSASPCSGGSYDDHDDLVFTVGGGTPDCAVDGDCDDGAFCNGAETCNAGTCQSGIAVDCGDGVSCTADSCNEGTDSCDNTPDDGLCSNGLFCDGSETCHATLGCQAGSAPDCDDGVTCTDDSCNEGTDQCDNVPNDGLCDDGLFCNGSETCNATVGCEAGGDPCDVFGCDEGGDVCLECNVDADCDDGLFCNGAETCSAGSCQAGSDPCPGQSCDESGDQCVAGGACTHGADFESGAGGWTQGADSCSTGSFIVGTPDSTAWQVGGGNPGQAFFTANNPSGVGGDDVDGGTCEALSPVIDCAGQAAAEVTLDYFHGQRDAGDDSSDGFTIEVLNDGAVVDTMVNIGDVTNNASWTTVSTVVTDPGDIQVRVRATDAPAGGDIVEGGIDNVSISPTTPPVPCAVEEDFEGGAGGWFNDGSSTCTTGDFVAATPTLQTNGGVTTQVGGDHTSGTGNAFFSATNTSAGSNDVDGGTCVVLSPVYAVSEASDVSVWYFHGQRDAGGDDFFELEISTNGGSSWSSMVSIGAVTTNAAWTEATTSVAAGSNVRFRIRVADGPSGGDLVEAGVDDLSICPTP